MFVNRFAQLLRGSKKRFVRYFTLVFEVYLSYVMLIPPTVQR